MRNLTTPGLEKCFDGSSDSLAGIINWDKLVLQITGTKSKKISLQECNEHYRTPYSSGYKGLVLLADDLSMSDGGNASVLSCRDWKGTQSVYASTFAPTIPDDECFSADFYANKVTLRLSGCLAFEGKENCQLLFNPLIGVIISLVTLVKVIAMIFTARLYQSRAPPLLTTGDAIASFLGRPDETTKGMCWASLEYVKKGNWAPLPMVTQERQSSMIYERLSPCRQWRKAPTTFRWVVTLVV